MNQKTPLKGAIIGIIMTVIIFLSVSSVFSGVPQSSASVSGSVIQETHKQITSETSIKILNVQSYPTVGGNWTVMFNTTGKADLRITSVNGTAFSKDLEFLEVRCGDETLNCKCSETGYETSKVLTEGKHSLKFKSGSKILNNFYYVASQKND